MKKVKYSLRYKVNPAVCSDREIDALVRFCINAKIDDVMLVLGPIYHVKIDEVKEEVECAKKIKVALNKHKITVSLNPYISIGQVDVSYAPYDDGFEKLTDVRGKKAKTAVCPYCDEWRKYITELWTYYAEALKPERIYVEDDFRLHNHPSLYWGGCFCDRHMKLYEAALGERVDRETFYSAVVAEEETEFSKKCRKAYFEVARETMVDAAKFFGSMLNKLGVKAGLMTNDPRLSAVEGRDWRGIFKGLEGSELASARIHIGDYVQTSPQSCLWTYVQRGVLSAALIDGTAINEIEIENAPRTVYSKSVNFTRFQMELSQTLVPETFTLFIFEGSGATALKDDADVPKYEKHLSELKPYLQAFLGENITYADLSGIEIAVDENSALFVRSNGVCDGFNRLYPTDSWWGSYLAANGFPIKYIPYKKFGKKPLFIGGNFLRGMSSDEIRSLFRKKRIILDGESVLTLYEKGLGDLLGIERFEIISPDGYEKCLDVPEELKSKAASSFIPCSGRYIKLKTSLKKKTYSVFVNRKDEYLADGIVGLENVLIIPKIVEVTSPVSFFDPIPFNCYDLRPKKRELLQYALNDFCESDYCDNDAVAVFKYETAKFDYFYLVNYIDDICENPSLHFTKNYSDFSVISKDNPDWKEVCYKDNCGLVGLELKLQPESTVLVKAKKKTFQD